MLGGFNTNVRYGGRKFHVQTEDNGRTNPKIITLLYEGGVILTSKRSSYEGHLESEGLSDVVRELMEQQHREMLRALKVGEFDDKIGLDDEGDEVAVSAPIVEARPSAPARLPEFGEGIITDTPLDELVLGYLGAE